MKSDSKLALTLGWITTPFYVTFFFLILCLYHPIHMIARIFGRRAHKYTLDLMNVSITTNMSLTSGARFYIDPIPEIPKDRSVILIANHQSMYDIPMMMWMLRKRELGFISKKELGKWVPSISFSLRELESVLIDRSDPKNALKAIEDFGALKERKKQIACIFPEGTRARDGKIKTFKTSGFESLLRSMPSALLMPVAIDGNWEFLRYKFKPVPYGVKIRCKVLPPREQSGKEPKQQLAEVAEEITAQVMEWRRI